MAVYPKASEVCVSASDAISMMNDPAIVVVTAIPDVEDRVAITYWLNEDGQLPPWITVKKAA